MYETAIFDRYARYYDVLYRDKDYAAEARFVHDRLLRGGIAPGWLLELGSGSGRHAIELARLGWQVKGYDQSSTMVAAAIRSARSLPRKLRSRVAFDVGDMRRLTDPGGYAAVISLFHVVCYLTLDEELAATFQTAADRLGSGGLFFFDFWYGPAVVADPPVRRVKHFEDKTIAIDRTAEPHLDREAHRVTIDYELRIQERGSTQVETLRERHVLRYFDRPELEDKLRHAGFEVVTAGRWMDDVAPDPQSWYVWLMARKR
jgi:SAM-dependent methyltransferase